MAHMLRFTALSVFLAAAISIGLPAAAHAHADAGGIYPPAGSCTVAPTTVAAGGTVEFACIAGTFSSDETVTITITGENGSEASIGFVRFAITTASGTLTSGADGSVAATPITLPGNASGTYNIAAVSETSIGSTATVSITGTNTGGLPTTGLDAGALLGIYIGGGALLVAGAAFGVASVVRRRRSESAA